MQSRTRRALANTAVAMTVAATIGAGLTVAVGAQRAAQGATQVRVDPDDIGGIVRSPNGPEAGVWVIAETDSLPTRFRKIVVTDDQGRFPGARSAPIGFRPIQSVGTSGTVWWIPRPSRCVPGSRSFCRRSLHQARRRPPRFTQPTIGTP